MKQKLRSLLEAYGGTIDTASLTGSAKQALDTYVMLSGVRPTLVPTATGIQATPPSRFAQIHFVKKLGVNAITSLADEVPVLLVFGATPFALEDYFNRLLAHSNILSDFDAAQEVLHLGREPLKLNFDYGGIIAGKFPDTIPLTADDLPEGWTLAPGAARFVSWRHYLPAKPKSERRCDLVTFLYMTAVSFLVAHELAHVDNGHLEFMDQGFGATSIPEFGADDAERSGRPVSSDTLHAIEVHADRNGVERSFVSALARPDILKGSIVDQFRSSLDPEAAMRLWLFAIAALLFLFESNSSRSRRWSLFGKQSTSHPGGFFRLMTAATTARLLLKDQPELRAAFDAAWRRCLPDIGVIAQILGIHDSWRRYFDRQGNVDFERLFPLLESLLPEFERCRIAISDHYYSQGVKVETGVKSAAAADDPFHLAGQRVELFYPNGVVRERRFFYPARTEYYDEQGALIRVQGESEP
jgi:hypothetical protein